jgi:tRNA(fMet)-specific endonuclease VapC
LRNNQDVINNLEKHLIQFGFVYIGVVTYYEVLNGLYFKDAKSQLKKFEHFVELNEVLPLTDKIAKKSAKIYSILRQKGQIIRHNDVMIAATSIVNEMTLVSNNTEHFSRISGLVLENWSV